MKPCNIYFTCFPSQEHDKKRDLEQKYKILLLSYGFKQEFGFPYEEALLSFGVHKKPFVTQRPNCCFNLSHSAGLIACGFSSAELGIDIELPKPVSNSLRLRTCTNSESESLSASSDSQTDFFRFWTQKESYLKLTGNGLTCRLSTLQIPDTVFQTTITLPMGHILTVSSYEPLELSYFLMEGTTVNRIQFI